MAQPDPASQTQRHVIQYWYVDGTFEFTIGGICLLLALYFYLQDVLKGTLIGEMLIPFFVVFIIAGSWLVNRLVMRMKERLTFPRTGFISFRQESGGKRNARTVIAGVLGMLISAFVVWLVFHRPGALDWIPAMSGLLFGVAIGIFAWRTFLLRFLALALFSAVLGMVLSLPGLTPWSGVTLYYLGMGVISVSVGVWVLVKYLRQNTKPQEE